MQAQHITGSGTTADPYILYNAADFDSIRYIGNYFNTSYKFGNDIDFAGWGNFTPIDSIPHLLNGDGYVLKNIEITTTTARLYNAIFKFGSQNPASYDTVKNIIFSFNRVLVDNYNGTFAADQEIRAAILICNSNYLRATNCIFYKNEITVYGRQTSVAGNDIQALYVGMFNSNTLYNSQLTRSYSSENKIYINGRIDGGSNVGMLWGRRGASASYYNATRKNSVYYKNHKTANVSSSYFGTVEAQSGAANGEYFFSYEDTIRVVTAGTYYGYAIGGISANVSKGGIIGNNPVWNNCWSRTIIQLDSMGVNINNRAHPLFPQYTSITFSANYADTSFYTAYYPYNPETIPNVVYCDSTDLRDSTFLTNFNFTSEWDMDKTGDWGYFPILQLGMPSVIVPPDIIPAAVDLLYPNGGETFNYPDTVNITFTTNTDTHYVYYSLNNGSTWSFIDTVFVDTSLTTTGSYSWNIPDSTSLQARIKIERDPTEIDSSLSAFYIIGSGATIEILSAALSGETLTATVESNYVDTLFVYQGTDTLTMDLVASGIVDPGDGIYPDTTVYTWNISDIPTAAQMFIKATTNNSLNITSADYSDSLRNSGRSGYYVSAQAPIFHTNVFTSGSDYYRISWKAELWGWYDYNDRIGVWKFNKTTLVWEKISEVNTDGVFYPKLDGYRASGGFVITNKSTTSPRYFVSPTTTVAQNFGTRQSGTFPAKIDQSNSTAASGTWIYTASDNDVIASDIVSGATFTFITDARVSPIELAVIDDDWLMITRNVITGQGQEPYSYIYPLLRSSIAAAYDIYTLDLTGSRRRNYFRGIYPNAIIQYYPPIR